MKKVLLIGLILAICILAFPQGVMAAETGNDNVIVTASFTGTALQFDAFQDPGFTWALVESAAGIIPPNGNLKVNGMNFTVDSRADYTVTAVDSKGTDRGHMTNGGSGAGYHFLANPFLIEGTSTMVNLEGTGTTPVTIQAGTPALTNFKKDIDQAVVQSDYAAPSYAITVTFTCTNSWP
jgi:hypothetical protein